MTVDDDRSKRRFSVDTTSGTFFWVEPGVEMEEEATEDAAALDAAFAMAAAIAAQDPTPVQQARVPSQQAQQTQPAQGDHQGGHAQAHAPAALAAQIKSITVEDVRSHVDLLEAA